MQSKFCVMKVDGERAYGQLISDVRDEYIEIGLTRFGNIQPRPGDVYDLDYAMRAIAILGISEEKFFNLEVDVVTRTRLKHPVVATSMEEAVEKFSELVKKNPTRYLNDRSSEIIDEASYVELPESRVADKD